MSLLALHISLFFINELLQPDNGSSLRVCYEDSQTPIFSCMNNWSWSHCLLFIAGPYSRFDLQRCPFPLATLELPAFQISVNAGSTSNVSGLRGERKTLFFLAASAWSSLQSVSYSFASSQNPTILIMTVVSPRRHSVKFHLKVKQSLLLYSESFLIQPSFTRSNQFPPNQT